MIWVIGDIHGMFDPLKLLLTAITPAKTEKGTQCEIEKIIFLGDYIDYGPSSREVVDTIMNLPFETVCLMGNHEDLMLQFLEHSELFESFGNVWFRGNGGQRTVSSFFPQIQYTDSQEDMPREEFPLEERYLQFFKNLKLTHQEQIGPWKLVFAHAMLNSDFPVQDQLALKNYEEFHGWRNENNVWIEDTLLWNRKEPKQKFDDHILIHGHTPTCKLDSAWKDLHGYDPKSATPFFKFEADETHPVQVYTESFKVTYTAPVKRLISIDADTGAVYGDRLTAIGLSEDAFRDGKFLVYQVLVNKGYRLGHEFKPYHIYLD